jgi:hypothetical protein
MSSGSRSSVGGLERPEIDRSIGVAIRIRREVYVQVRSVEDAKVLEAKHEAVDGLDDRGTALTEVEVVGALELARLQDARGCRRVGGLGRRDRFCLDELGANDERRCQVPADRQHHGE